MSRRFVLDTSVVVKWFFLDEPQRQKALQVQEGLIENPNDFLVPFLFYSELIHVLTRKSGADAAFVSECIDAVSRFGIRSLALNQSGLASAIKYCSQGLSGYDATYVALAVEHGALWLTADEKAAKRVPSAIACSLVNY